MDGEIGWNSVVYVDERTVLLYWGFKLETNLLILSQKNKRFPVKVIGWIRFLKKVDTLIFLLRRTKFFNKVG
jgi:hypothetical protein